MALHRDAEALLRAIVKAGADGLDVPPNWRGDAAALIRDELVTASLEGPYRVQATAKGAAFSMRGAT